MKLALTLGKPSVEQCGRCGRLQVLTVPIHQVDPSGDPGHQVLLARHQVCPACGVLLTVASALFSNRFTLIGDSGGGVALRCTAEPCHDGGRPLAYLPGTAGHPDPRVPAVAAVFELAGIAVDHLRDVHPQEQP
ncbi:hypothetical protein [Nonomuraea sp. NPDC049646]|uniref:hypothetical protein n=1 Tax=unclassified Nonomuraea TaxID=2593643 RepID=UPI00378A2344